MTDDLTEVDTTEASQDASASVLSETKTFQAGEADGGTTLFLAPTLDRIRTSD